MSAQIVAIHVQHSLVIVYPSRNMLYLRFLVCFMINIKSVNIKFTEVVLDVLSRILDTLILLLGLKLPLYVIQVFRLVKGCISCVKVV